jgi:hypothetical protein
MDYSIILCKISFITGCYAYVRIYYVEFLFGEICFSCIGLLDRFLQQCITSTNESNHGFITQKNLQLIAVATFLIAAKVEVSLRRLIL